MPFNITTGSTVQFTVEFFSSANILTVPTSATLTITYPLSSNSLVTTTATIGMTQSGNFFIGSWGSGVAALGLSSFSVSGAGQASPTTGTLRIHS